MGDLIVFILGVIFLKKLISFLILFCVCFSIFIAFPYYEAKANPVVAVAPGVIAALGTALVYAGFEFSDTDAIKACAVDLYRNMDTNSRIAWENTSQQLIEHGQANSYLGKGFVEAVQNWYDNEYNGEPLSYNSESGTFDYDHWSGTSVLNFEASAPAGVDYAVGWSGDVRHTMYGSGRVTFGRVSLYIHRKYENDQMLYRLYLRDSLTDEEYTIRGYQLDPAFLGCSLLVQRDSDVLSVSVNGSLILQRNWSALVSASDYFDGSTQQSRGSFFSMSSESVSPENHEVNAELYDYIAQLINSQLVMTDAILDLSTLVGATPYTLENSGVTEKSVAVPVPDELTPEYPDIAPEFPDTAVGEGGWLSSISDWCGSIWNSITSGFQATWQAITNVGVQVSSISTAITSGLIGNVSTIDVSGIRSLGGTFTQKFPFSLPWDLKNSIQSFSSSSSSPSFSVGVPNPINSSVVEVDFSIPEAFSFIVPFIRSVLLFLFSLGLIYATPKLFGGGT